MTATVAAKIFGSQITNMSLAPTGNTVSVCPQSTYAKQTNQDSEINMKLPISIGTAVLNINKSHGDYFTQGIVVPPAFKGDQFINIELKYYDGSTRVSIAKPWELKELS